MSSIAPGVHFARVSFAILFFFGASFVNESERCKLNLGFMSVKAQRDIIVLVDSIN
jgi:hypothetical protein